MYQDREEWSRARSTGKHIELGLREYTELLKFVGSHARVYDINYDRSLGVKFFDKTQVQVQEPTRNEEFDLELLDNDLESFDSILESDDALRYLEKELGLA